MKERVPLNDDQQAILTAVSDLERSNGRPPALAELAAQLGWSRSQTRDVLPTLLSDQADLVRELSGDEPAEATYTVKEQPT